MAVTNIALDRAGASGDWDREGFQFTATYKVTCDSPLDGPQRDLSALASRNGVYIGSAYRYGNEQNQAAWCDRISPRPRAGNANIWDVEAHYGPLPQRQRNENDEPEDDPTQWKDQISITVVKRSLAVEKAKYIEGF